jgi:hypothetical protein
MVETADKSNGTDSASAFADTSKDVRSTLAKFRLDRRSATLCRASFQEPAFDALDPRIDAFVY